MENENNEKRLQQIDWSIIGIIILIFILVHSIYLLINEKKGLLGEESLSEEEFLTQAIFNRGIASVIIIMFLLFEISNLKDLVESDEATEELIKDQKLNVLSSLLALIAVLIGLYLPFKSYITLRQQETTES